jgi:hypothetical protein
MVFLGMLQLSWQIPIEEGFEDFYASHYDEKGQFSVKSAFKLYVKIQDGPQASTSADTDSAQF